MHEFLTNQILNCELGIQVTSSRPSLTFLVGLPTLCCARRAYTQVWAGFCMHHRQRFLISCCNHKFALCVYTYSTTTVLHMVSQPVVPQGHPPHNLHGCTVTVWGEFPIAWNNWTKCFAFKMFCFQNELAKWVVFHILNYRNYFFLVQNLIFINYRLRLLVQDFVWRKLFTSCNQNDHRIIRKAVMIISICNTQFTRSLWRYSEE